MSAAEEMFSSASASSTKETTTTTAGSCSSSPSAVDAAYLALEVCLRLLDDKSQPTTTQLVDAVVKYCSNFGVTFVDKKADELESFAKVIGRDSRYSKGLAILSHWPSTASGQLFDKINELMHENYPRMPFGVVVLSEKGSGDPLLLCALSSELFVVFNPAKLKIESLNSVNTLAGFFEQATQTVSCQDDEQPQKMPISSSSVEIYCVVRSLVSLPALPDIGWQEVESVMNKEALQEVEKLKTENLALKSRLALLQAMHQPTPTPSNKPRKLLSSVTPRPFSPLTPPPDAAERPPSAFFCRICLEENSMENVCVLTNCRHQICRPCGYAYMRNVIADKQALIICPLDHCRQELNFNDAELLLEPEDIRQLRQRLFEQATSSANFVKCPRPNCRGLVELLPPRSKFTCPICRFDMCTDCRQPWHFGRNCNEGTAAAAAAGAVAEGLDEATLDRRFDEYAKSRHFQTCPDCGRVVEKTAGCNHMTCKCQSHFCYNCGGKMKFGHGGLPEHVCPRM